MVICWHRAKIEIFLETLEKLPSASQVFGWIFWQFKTSMLSAQAERSEARAESILVENCQNIQPKTRLALGNFSRVSWKIKI